MFKEIRREDYIKNTFKMGLQIYTYNLSQAIQLLIQFEVEMLPYLTVLKLQNIGAEGPPFIDEEL